MYVCVLSPLNKTAKGISDKISCPTSVSLPWSQRSKIPGACKSKHLFSLTHLHFWSRLGCLALLCMSFHSGTSGKGSMGMLVFKAEMKNKRQSHLKLLCVSLAHIPLVKNSHTD